MTYASVSRKRQGKMTATGLSGGLNRRELPFAVEDDQLTDCCNLWWRNGVLRTRPALRIVEMTGTSGERTYAAGADAHYVMRKNGSTLITGEIREDGTHLWNTAAQTAPNGGWRVHYDVTRLEGWTAGEGDGTILFLADGQAVAPLAAGGYQSLSSFVYVPQLLVGGVGVASFTAPPMTIFEPPNLLTTAFRASYTTDGVGKLFFLPVKAVDTTHPIVAVHRDADGNSVTHTIAAGSTVETTTQQDGLRMVLSTYRNCLFFVSANSETAQAPPAVGISDNLTVTAYFADDAAADNAAIIGGMRFGCWFGGESSGLVGGTRLFVSGNPDYPHRIYWSDTDRPLYFPQDNYAAVGDAGQAVTAFGKQNEMLVIFKEHELYAATYRAQTVTATDTSGARFPLVPLHGEIGCDCPATIQLCQNRLVWLTGEGRVYTLVSGNAYSQCNVRPVSGVIEPLLKSVSVTSLREASAGYYSDWYCLLVDGGMLLLRCDDAAFERITSSSGGDVSWYRWTFDETVQPERVLSFANDLVLVDAQGRGYRFGGVTDRVVVDGRLTARAVPCSFCTKLFDFGYADRFKTVRELLFTFGALEYGTLTATYVTDRGRRQEHRSFRVDDVEEHEADFLRACRLTPHATRVRRFALEVSTTGTVAFGPLTIRYDIENAMEKGVG